MTKHRPFKYFLLGAGLCLAIVSFLFDLTPEKPMTTGQYVLFSSQQGVHSISTPAQPVPTLSLPHELNKDFVFDACYVQDQNADWAIFKPHWKYGQMMFVIKWSDPNSAAMLLYVAPSHNSWAKLSQDSPYAAVALGLDNGKGQVVVYSLKDGKNVATYETGFAPSIYDLNADRLVFTAFDEMETTANWREASTSNWSIHSIDPPEQPMIVGLEPTANVIAAVHQKAPFCKSWPGYASS